MGTNECVDDDHKKYDSAQYLPVDDAKACQAKCSEFAETGALVGFEYTAEAQWCFCLFAEGYLESEGCPKGADRCTTCNGGSGPVGGTSFFGDLQFDFGPVCYRYGFPGHDVSFDLFIGWSLHPLNLPLVSFGSSPHPPYALSPFSQASDVHPPR